MHDRAQGAGRLSTGAPRAVPLLVRGRSPDSSDLIDHLPGARTPVASRPIHTDLPLRGQYRLFRFPVSPLQNSPCSGTANLPVSSKAYGRANYIRACQVPDINCQTAFKITAYLLTAKDIYKTLGPDGYLSEHPRNQDRQRASAV